jgi:molybdopterin/thiamine biosynthesis adenylyltransferase
MEEQDMSDCTVLGKERLKYRANVDEARYWERVHRNLGWLGNTEEEQLARQTKLKNAVIGVAGCGGIGGGFAERLLRMGVQNIKLADPDTFEISNINRQLGASVANVGRNKAEVVAETLYQICPDINIDVYPEGICEETVDEFFDGCDYVMDKMDIYASGAHYTLHDAFRRNQRCRYMMFTPVFGFRTFAFTYTRDSMPIQEIFGVPRDATNNRDHVAQLINRLIPEMPAYPNKAMLDKWFVDEQCCPIFAGMPPISQGILANRLALDITGLMDDLPHVQRFPKVPGYAMFDSMTWETKIVESAWW